MSDVTIFIARFTLFAVVHSLFATNRAKQLLHGTDRQGYRLCYNIGSLVMFGWVMSAHRHSDVLYFVPGVMSLIMYLMQLVVGLILVSCLRQTGIGRFLGIGRRSSGSFTTGGWYGVVRHPLYFFLILFMVLSPVMTSQWLILTILSAVYCLVGGLLEEKRLEVEFGEEYRRYRQQVPFFFPNLAGWMLQKK